MSPIINPLPKETTDRRFRAWIDILKRQESVNIVFTPWSDKYYRVRQFVDSYLTSALPNAQSALVVAESLSTENGGEFETQIRRLFPNPNKPKLVFLMDGDWIIRSIPQLFARIQLLTEVPHNPIQFIVIFEQDITSARNIKKLSSYEMLHKNILNWPLYNEAEIRHFLNYKSRKFGLKLTKKQTDTITHACGGHIWLATGALRILANSKDIELTKGDFEYRLDLIWNSFDENQKILLEKCCRGVFPDSEQPSITYLFKLGIIDKTCKITIPALSEYILKKTNNKITTNQNNVYVNGINVNKLFTYKEIRFLKLVIENPKLLTREEAALCFWPDGVYSDWGLDKSISRLRHKLNSLGIPKDSLLSIKRKGIRWRQYD